MKFTDGFMIHSGQPTRDFIDYAVRHVLLRQGVLGVKVKVHLLVVELFNTIDYVGMGPYRQKRTKEASSRHGYYFRGISNYFQNLETLAKRGRSSYCRSIKTNCLDNKYFSMYFDIAHY